MVPGPPAAADTNTYKHRNTNTNTTHSGEKSCDEIAWSDVRLLIVAPTPGADTLSSILEKIAREFVLFVDQHNIF